MVVSTILKHVSIGIINTLLGETRASKWTYKGEMAFKIQRHGERGLGRDDTVAMVAVNSR